MRLFLSIILSAILPQAVSAQSGGDACHSVFGTVEFIDGLPPSGFGGAVSVEGDILYAGSGDVIVSYDISSPLEPRMLCALPGFDQVRQLVVRDGFVYVVSRETGMRIVDARNPESMKIRSRFDSVEFATGIDVAGTVAFLSERINGVEVVDVSDPDNPEHVCIRKTRESQSNIYRDGYLYSGEWAAGQVTVFDAHDLSDFHIIRKLELGGFGDGVCIDGNYLYASTGHDARHHRCKTCGDDPVGAGHGLDIFDLSNPAKPKHLSRVDFPVFAPKERDFWTPRVSNGIAFCCDSHNGLFAVDVRNPKKPELLDELLIPTDNSIQRSKCPSSLAIGRGCVYVIFNPGGLYVIPVSGVEPPKQEEGYLPEGIRYRETYPTDTTAFHVYRPSAAGQARTVRLRGDYVYAAFGDAGLHILKITDGGFERIGELPGGHRVTDCCFIGEKMLTAEGLDGFALYELDGPATFREIARRSPFAGNVAFWCWPLDDHRALVSSRSKPYDILDLNDFNAAESPATISCTCQWDKYPADGATDGYLPILNPYVGLVWLVMDGDDIQIRNDGRPKDPTNVSGSQMNGLCRLDSGRFFYTTRKPGTGEMDGGYYALVGTDGHIDRVLPLPDVPAFGNGKDAYFTGIPRTDGHILLITNRSQRKAVVYDLADPETPVVKRAYTLSGHPDTGALYQGRAIIPAGHQGVIMEK